MSMPAGRSGYESKPTSDTEAGFPGLDENWRRRRIAFTAFGLILVVALVGALVWHSTRASSRIDHVRYTNDTGARVVVTPCGAAARCVIEAGASVVLKPPTKGDVWRVIDARTRQSAGCISHSDDAATVRLSSTRYGGFC